MESEWRSAMQKRLHSLRRSAIRRTRDAAPFLSQRNILDEQEGQQSNALHHNVQNVARTKHASDRDDDSLDGAELTEERTLSGAEAPNDVDTSRGEESSSDKKQPESGQDREPRLVHVHRSGSITVTGVRLRVFCM